MKAKIFEFGQNKEDGIIMTFQPDEEMKAKGNILPLFSLTEKPAQNPTIQFSSSMKAKITKPLKIKVSRLQALWGRSKTQTVWIHNPAPPYNKL